MGSLFFLFRFCYNSRVLSVGASFMSVGFFFSGFRDLFLIVVSYRFLLVLCLYGLGFFPSIW